MATIDYKQLATPEANLIELLSAQNQDGTYTAKLMGSEPFAVLAAKTIYNAYNDIEDNMAADVEGPASSTDNALARFDGTTGKLLQNSNAILTDAGALSLASNLTVSGTGITLGGNAAVNPLVTINSATNAGGGLLFQAAGVPKALIGLSSYILGGTSTDTIIYSNGNSILFYPSGASGGSITSSGATFTGNLTVSGTASSFGGFTNAGGAVYVRKDSGEVFRADAAGAGYRIVADQNGVLLGGATTTVSGNLTVSGGTISSGSGTLTLNSSANTVVLQSAGTTALTLDSSQNATFAGTVTFGKGAGNTTFSANGTTAESGIFTQANTGFVFFSDNATATKGIKVDVNNGGLTVLSGGLTTATAGGSAGTWKLGVYSATAPSATGYVTIDIGGTIYKLLAST